MTNYRLGIVIVELFKYTFPYIFIDEKRRLSDGSDDFFEYTRGKKIPPEGIPGFDFSDPESIVEFTKSVKQSACSF